MPRGGVPLPSLNFSARCIRLLVLNRPANNGFKGSLRGTLATHFLFRGGASALLFAFARSVALIARLFERREI